MQGKQDPSNPDTKYNPGGWSGSSNSNNKIGV